MAAHLRKTLMKPVQTYRPPELPLAFDLETKPVLKKTTEARAALAELDGVVGLIPNREILMQTLPLQEARASSEIENIVTTRDELYKSNMRDNFFASAAAKEVHLYASALTQAQRLAQDKGVLSEAVLREAHRILSGNSAGYRAQPGTTLKNDRTGEIVFVPPQEKTEIERLMRGLERFINERELCDWDPLVKMAVAHHQFESIHPFYDGNGRTGRILNILFLMQEELLDAPVLYLSRYINRYKARYYELLQLPRETADPAPAWREWTLFMLEGVAQTSRETSGLIRQMREQMQRFKHVIRDADKRMYSQDLVNLLFRFPYTKISHAERELGVSRATATKYLNNVAGLGLLERHKFGREVYYLNIQLLDCLSAAGE